MTGKLACANCASNSMYPSKDCMLQFLLLPSAHYQGGELIWIFVPRDKVLKGNRFSFTSQKGQGAQPVRAS
jgi:hypothetical protein